MPSPEPHDRLRPRPRRARRLLGVPALLYLASLVAVAQPPPGRPTGPRLTDHWVRWAADVAPLMSEAEREAFFALGSSTDRASFARAFWRGRGPEAASRWARNAEDARLLELGSAGRRAALLLGKPSRIELFPRCGGLRRLEAWSWPPPAPAGPAAAAPAAPAVLVFARATSFDARSLAPWEPGDLEQITYASHEVPDLETALSRAAGDDCLDGARLDRLRELLAAAASLDELRRRAPWPAPPAGWLGEWRASLAEGDGERWPDARLEISFPGGFNASTIVAGRLEVRAGRLHELAPGQLFDRVTVTGDVYRGARLADSFRVVHHVAGAPGGPAVPLEFHRRLRPATYTLDLRAVDRADQTLLARRLELRVPASAAPAPPPPGRALGYSHLTRPDVVLLTTFPAVELLPASAEGHGRMRLYASTTGGPIDAVEFRLDGREIAVDGDPPYAAEIASATERRLAEAIARDPAGRPLARHERWVEPERRAFFVRFARPADDHVPVTVSLPAGSTIARLDCLRGRRPTAELGAPPWRCPLPERFAARGDFLTVRATLASGEVAEDVLFLGSAAEQVDVRLAELLLSVVDAAGRPVLDLGEGDFRLRDARGELTLVGVEPLADLPLNLVLLMDVSSSMGRDVQAVAESARRFFATVLEPGDLAALQAFNHDLHHLASFTGDAARLAHAAAGLRAGGSTRLHDAVVYALHQFSGLGSRRALIVLSDGADVGSDYPFEQVVDEAVGSGVTVYPISLATPEAAATEALARLARLTGGRHVTTRGVAGLDDALEQIAAELRAQYLLVFRPRGAAPVQAFREIRVELPRPGLQARDVHGRQR